MVETPLTSQTRLEEMDRCREWSWFAEEDEQHFGPLNPEAAEEFDADPPGQVNPIHHPQPIYQIEVGAKVVLGEDEALGQVTKIIKNLDERISHFVVQTSRFFGHEKLVSYDLISSETPLKLALSISFKEFMALPEYRSDYAIAEDADRALSNDVVLRNSDYRQIAVRVKDGFIAINGHVISRMNQWRAETALKTVSGVVGIKNFLIPDDQLLVEVAGALGKIELEEDCKFFTKMENGVVLIMGEVESAAVRDRAEQCVADIPWVRGVMNEVCAPGVDLKQAEQPFFQPAIGKELVFKDELSVTVRKVVIDPHNRRVTAVVVLGRFANRLSAGSPFDPGYPVHQRLIVIPVAAIRYLTSNGGLLSLNSDETSEYQRFDPSRFMAPPQNWLPPYPYCHAEVLFKLEYSAS